jgi:ElaB protein
MNNSGKNPEAREKLIDDLKSMMQDAQDLLQKKGQQASSGYESARDKFQSTWRDAKSNLGNAQEKVYSSSKDAMDNADRYVQENPWQAVGIGAAAGLVLGLLLGRK